MRIIPPSNTIIHPIREVTARYLGNLITVRGMVLRISEVSPRIVLVTYKCELCGEISFQDVVNKAKFTPLVKCTSSLCTNGGKLRMQQRANIFQKFRTITLQGLSQDIPSGFTQRMMIVHVYGNLGQTIKCGDACKVSGIFLPIPGKGGFMDVYMEAQQIEEDHLYGIQKLPTPDMEQMVVAMSQDHSIYQKLANSIAPEICGWEDVKKALLLQLVGGVAKNVGDGMKIRGDIHILLIGDPGLGKSQMLKFISRLSPRGVYATGTGSSGAGLTAAVISDPTSHEKYLECGAIVIANGGICCIDEFDKMPETTITALHEVMEQQTISISKAGIYCVLKWYDK